MKLLDRLGFGTQNRCQLAEENNSERRGETMEKHKKKWFEENVFLK